VQPRLVPPSWVIARAPAGERRIALTFDDGPDPASTPRLLDILARSGVSASLFFVGRQAVAHPQLVREAVARGHQVSNHGFDHSRQPRHPWRAYRENILRGEQALQAACPEAVVRCFRPPRGAFPKRLLPWVLLHGRTLALWSLDSGDSFAGGEAVLANLRPERVRCGEVILLHEDQSATLDVLAEIIARLRAAGHSFATLQEWQRRFCD
jgi:peptidoglycan/xylan/chitin deacetylase (PgdA/CDA1 family)